MTVSTTLNKITQNGDGVTTTYSFPFAVTAGGQSTIQVFVTSATGVLTQLAFGTQYTVTLNAPISPNPTPVGGVVNLASPAGAGTLVTIVRTLPLTQPTSLANQGNLYQPVLETMDDGQVMQLQQVSEIFGRAIVVALSDPTPLPLPPAAQRANQGMGFDSLGNPVPIAILPAGTVSPAMQPVVNAATIAIAVNLLGLTGVAPEPPGVVKAFAGTVLPSGYLWCNGTTAPRTGATAALFAAIGTTYGPGDGSTTFNLPDLRGRVIAGVDNMGGAAAAGRLTSNTITGGATTTGNSNGLNIEQNTVSIAQLPVHAHPVFLHDPGHSHDIRGAANTAGGAAVSFSSNSAGSIIGGTGGTGIVPLQTSATLQSAADTGTWPSNTPNGTPNSTATVGSGNPVNNVQPTMVLNYIIKT